MTNKNGSDIIKCRANRVSPVGVAPGGLEPAGVLTVGVLHGAAAV